jgi:hypothetical protein
VPRLRSTSQKNCFKLLSSAKWRPRSTFFTGTNRWQSEGASSGLWAGWGRTVHPMFAVASRVRKLVWGCALSWRRRTSFMFRLGRTQRMYCRSLFEVSLYRSWCAPKSRQGILQEWRTATYSTLANYVENDEDFVEQYPHNCKRRMNRPCKLNCYFKDIFWGKIWRHYFRTAPHI